MRYRGNVVACDIKPRDDRAASFDYGNSLRLLTIEGMQENTKLLVYCIPGVGFDKRR